MSYFTKKYHPPGTAPGTLHGSEERPGGPSPRMHAVDYSHERFEELYEPTPQQCRTYLEDPSITWIHVQGRMESDALRELGEIFNLHSLALEDVVNTGQRPKLEIYGEQLFIVLSVPSDGEQGVQMRQVSIFSTGNEIISFYDGNDDLFEPVYRRLRAAPARFAQRGEDYLLYAIIDLVIDAGFPVLEAFDERIEELEEVLLNDPDRGMLHGIHAIKRELLTLRRMLWPQRELISGLLRSDEVEISENTRLYLRDCYDHTLQIIDLIETYRDMTSNMIDIYLSSMSNRLSDAMRVLTIIATLFIPPTFIVGVYGMNFDPAAGPLSMPELASPYGYAVVWSVILLLMGGLLVYFKRKQWL